MFYRKHVKDAQRKFNTLTFENGDKQKIAKQGRLAIEVDLYVIPILLLLMCECMTRLLITTDGLHPYMIAVIWCVWVTELSRWNRTLL